MAQLAALLDEILEESSTGDETTLRKAIDTAQWRMQGNADELRKLLEERRETLAKVEQLEKQLAPVRSGGSEREGGVAGLTGLAAAEDAGAGTGGG